MRKDWLVLKLGEFIPQKGSSIDPRKHSAEVFELYSVPSHETNQPEIVKGKDIGATKQRVENNWVMLSRINPHLNRCWVIKSLSERTKIASSEWVFFPPHSAFVPDYLGYFLVQSRIKNLMLANISGVGGSLTRTNKNAIREFELALPPLPEQRAIVAKLEQLFSELDNGIANLQRVQEKLKVYRQAVLKKAFEGELTKEWRAKQKDLPTAETLLEQIKEERARHYSEQLEEWKVAVKNWEKKGKVGKKPGKPSKLTEPDDPSTEHEKRKWLLPIGWIWTQVGWLAFVTKLAGFEYTKHVVYSDKGDLRVIKAENAGKLGFNPTDYSKIDSDSVSMLTRSKLVGGELLIVFVGAGTGQVATVPHSMKFFLGPNIGMARPYVEINNKYIELFLRSPLGRDLLMAASKAVAQPSLSMGTIRQAPVALPSRLEQHQIVQEIESRLSVCDKLEESITTNLQKAEALRQSILKKAFEGALLSAAELAACRKEKDWCPAGELLGKSSGTGKVKLQKA